MSYRRYLSVLFIVLLVLSAIFSVETVLAQEAGWSNRFFIPGTEGEVRAVAAYGDGYAIGGDFRWLGPTRVGGLAYNDGAQWVDLTGGTDIVVRSLAVHKGDLIASGTFESIGGVSARNIARWDGTQWHALGAGLDGPVLAIMSFQDDLYCGPYRWDGSTWENVFLTNDNINAMVVWHDRLIVGGEFTEAFGGPVDHVFAWDGNQVDTGLSGWGKEIQEFTVHDGDLIALEPVSHVFGPNPYPVRRWNGAAWNVMGGELLATQVHTKSLFVFRGDLYLVYKWSPIYVSKAYWETEAWDGSAWVDTTPNLTCEQASVLDDQVVLAGTFTRLGSVSASHIATWDGQDFSAVVTGGEGLGSGLVNRWHEVGIAARPGDLCVWGELETAGDIRAEHIIRWTDDHWDSLNPPSPGEWYSGVCWKDDQLVTYAYDGSGTDFWYYVKAWSGGVWEAWTAALFWEVPVIENLVPRPEEGVACYGSGWQGIYQVTPLVTAVSSVADDAIHVLFDWNGQLLAGGEFSQIRLESGSYVEAEGIALFDGEAWQEIGGGVTGVVYAVAEMAGGLVVAGEITAAGGVPVNNIAYWNGDTWEPLGGGIPEGPIYTVTIDQNHVFAGGEFASVGGSNCRNIAYFDGTAWYGLGTGTNGPVKDLAVMDNRLYVSGAFTEAGGYAANLFTYWQDLTVGVEVLEFAATRDGSAVDLSWRLRHDPGQNLLIRRTAVTGSVTVAEIAAGSGPSGNLRDDDAPAGVLTYDLVEIDAGGAQQVITTAQVAATSLPVASLRIETVRPNPLNPQTTVTFTLGRTQHVRATVLDVAGRKVADLADGVMTAGRRTLTWNGQNATGHPASSGTYLIRIAAEDKVETAKVAVVR